MEKENIVKNSENKHSAQYQRTDDAIVRAFCTLLQKKPYEKITVNDILEATPISRAGFYAHYMDKEAIAEALQAKYIAVYQDIFSKLSSTHSSTYFDTINNALDEHEYWIRALLKIHTEKVDIVGVLANMHRTQYHTSENNEIEKVKAEVYSHTLTAFEFAVFKSAKKGLDVLNLYNEVMIDAFLNLMHMENDKSLRDYLLKKAN